MVHAPFEAGKDRSSGGLDKSSSVSEPLKRLGFKFDSKRERLRIGAELPNEVPVEFYELSEFDTKNENVDKMRKLDPVTLVGSVCSTRFNEGFNAPSWYTPYLNSAKQISVLYKKLDASTQKWFDNLKPALDLFVSLGGLNPNDFKLKYKGEISNLIKSNGKDIVYGEKGVLNFLLAFSRITNICPELRKVTDAGYDIEKLAITDIKLVLGGGKGSFGGKKDRYAYMTVQQKKAPDEGSGVTPKPSEVPPVDTDAYYDRYEVGKTPVDKQNFNNALKDMRGILAKNMLNSLKDDKFWDPVAGETATQKEVRLSKLFDRTSGTVSTAFIEMNNFRQNYPKYFDDIANPESVKLQELYFWLNKRLIEYSDGNIPDAKQRKLALLQYHQSMLEGVVSLRLNNGYKSPVLKQLVASAEYMKQNDPDTTNTPKWEALWVKYKAELAAI